MRRPLDTRLYYSISEVTQVTGLAPHTLRAWEKEFPCLRPRRSRGKNRAYRDRDIAIVLLLKRLLYEERYTVQGARQKLRHEPELVARAAGDPAVQRLLQGAPAATGGDPAEPARGGVRAADGERAARPWGQPDDHGCPERADAQSAARGVSVEECLPHPSSLLPPSLPPEVRALLGHARRELRQILGLLGRT